MKMISIFKDYKAIYDKPSFISIATAINRIRDSKYKDLIVKIRSTVDKKERNALKTQLPCFAFSGIFDIGVETKRGSKVSYRNDESLSEHSGYCVLDIDDINTSVEYTKSVLSSIDYIYCVFVSPSGNGLKALCKIPSKISTHRDYYRSIVEDLSSYGIECDSTSINESRICYESYDPNIYVNTECVEHLLKPKKDTTTNTPIGKNVSTEHNSLKYKECSITDWDKISVASKMILSSKEGEKHKTLIRASYLLGGYISAGVVKEEDAFKVLMDAIKTKKIDSIHNAKKTIEDGLNAGKGKPIYEIEDIEDDFKTTMSRKEYYDENRVYNFLINQDDEEAKLLNYIQNGEEEGKETGYDELDRHFRFKENNFDIILGHDNVGKSTLIWFLAVLSACSHDWKWIIFSPENKIYRIQKIMIDFVLGMKSESATKEDFKKAKDFIYDKFIFIRKDKEYSIFSLLEYGEVLCKDDKDIKGFLIDPYNSLSLDYKDKGKGLSGYEYHLKAATNMRIFSEKYCSVYMNAHSITESRRQVDADGNLKRPNKAHIDGGALWANRCDNFMVLHRKIKDENEWMWTEIHVDKVKDVETGGGVTYKDPVKLQLSFYSDFVDNKDYSPLRRWRKNFFKKEIEEKKSLPFISLEDAFK